MKNTYLVALVSSVLLGGVYLTPANASPISCSGGGNFTITGTIVSASSNCAGAAVIPNNVTEIATQAFIEAINLTTLSFQAGSTLQVIRNSAFSESGLTSVSFPASVKTIETLAFGMIPTLTSITFESGSTLETLGARAFALNSALTSVTFRGTSAPTSVAADTFSSIGANPKLYLEDGATGFGSVGDTWKALVIAAGGPIAQPPPPSASDPGPVSAPAPVALPAVLPDLPIVSTFSLDTPVLAKQQKKVLRTLIAEVGAGGSFEVVAGISAREGLGKKALRALAREKASAIKKYLVKRGVKKWDVTLRVKIYKVGASPDSHVLGSKPKDPSEP